MRESSDTPAPGHRIGGRYRLDAVVGRGGMSTVFRATDLELERTVAVKILSPSALAMSAFVTRVRHEASAASRLRGDHVVRIHDVGELEDGVPYLVMEYLSGSDLAVALARRGPFAVTLACQCILQACEGLAEAHALGIVHRDLKPANLFLVEREDGAPWLKVLDFGISRAPTYAGLAPLTDPGTVLGTPAYMSPEQMEGVEPLDARVDVWALGTILYELLAGEPRSRGDSLPQIFVNIMRSRPPRASRLRDDVPRALDAVIAKCLAVDASRRYASVAELAQALAPFVPDGRAQAERVARTLGHRPLPRHRSEPGKTIFAAACALLVGATVGFLALGRNSDAATAPRQEPATEIVPDAGAAEPVPVTIAAPR